MISNDADPCPPLLKMNAAELADLFFTTCFLVTASQFVKEEHWLKNRKNPDQEHFKEFIGEIFKREFLPILFMQAFFESSSVNKSKEIGHRARQIENAVLQVAARRPGRTQKLFAQKTLGRMVELFKFETLLGQNKKAQGLELGISFYRTFDDLDKLFNLNYDSEKGAPSASESPERLYSGSGVAVQSGYSTILAAINNLNLQDGDRVIDLGSGFGRVGLVIGLLKDKVDFKGYEFVGSRVAISEVATRNLHLDSHVEFLTCDLSGSFLIPDAEVYYLYDPFSDATYGRVLHQLAMISRRMKIRIVTKGNAREKLMELAAQESWPTFKEFDGGNLCIFASKP